MKQIWTWKKHKIAWQVENQTKDIPIAVLLIHGFGASKDHWRFNQKVISSLATCYAIDLIGFGESSQPNAQLLYEQKTINSFTYCFDNWSQQTVYS